MEDKYLLEHNGEQTTFKTLKQLSEHLDIPIHICRKIVMLNAGRIEQIKSHHRNRDIYNNVIIKEIPRKIKK